MDSRSIGGQLKDRRTGLGRSLDEVVQQTRIQSRFLEAIESDDLSVFPSIVFARNFVRQYALALELDPEPLVSRLPALDHSTVPLPEAPARPRARRTRLSKHPSWASAAWALAAAVVVSGAYLYHTEGWHITLERRAPAEQDTVKADSLPAPVNAPAAVEPTPAAEQREASPTESAPAATVVAPPPAPAPAADGTPIQVAITAQERTWIGIKVDGKVGYNYIGTLAPGESKSISATEQVRLSIGNAGGLTVSLNGKTLDALGRHGQFRNVRVTAEGLEFLARDPQPVAPAPAAAATDPL